MYDDILVPTDGSAGMETVIDHASSLAKVHNATLHGLYVIDTASLTDVPLEASMEGVSQSLRQEGKTALEQMERRTGDVPVQTEAIEGSPARDIVSYATENDCDVIVM